MIAARALSSRDRVYMEEMLDETRCYLVASAISCNGQFGLWQMPGQLEEDLAHLKPGHLATQHAARQLLVDKHLHISRGSDGSFFCTVVPPNLKQLLDKLRELETTNHGSNHGQQYRWAPACYGLSQSHGFRAPFKLEKSAADAASMSSAV